MLQPFSLPCVYIDGLSTAILFPERGFDGHVTRPVHPLFSAAMSVLRRIAVLLKSESDEDGRDWAPPGSIGLQVLHEMVGLGELLGIAFCPKSAFNSYFETFFELITSHAGFDGAPVAMTAAAGSPATSL